MLGSISVSPQAPWLNRRRRYFQAMSHSTPSTFPYTHQHCPAPPPTTLNIYLLTHPTLFVLILPHLSRADVVHLSTSPSGNLPWHLIHS